MKVLRVNADYEQELFYGTPGPNIINQTIEFLSFFLNPEPILSTKIYSESYLQEVERLSGMRPSTLAEGKVENWWGQLANLPVERWFNSKLTSAELIIQKGWCQETFILTDLRQLKDLDQHKSFIIKNPFGMSGQKFQLLRAKTDWSKSLELIQKNLKLQPLIVEPFLNRVYDFSQYVFPDGKIIAYQNRVDERFQYKGTLFVNHHGANLEDLPFSGISDHEWSDFKQKTSLIIQHYGQHPNESGYSIDSFVYEEEGKLKIRALSEINYRRTMGRVAHDLARRYAADRPWSLFLLGPTSKRDQSFSKTFLNKEDLMILSPEDSRFEMILLTANSTKQGQALYEQIQNLKP